MVQYAQSKRPYRLQPPSGGARCKAADCAYRAAAKTGLAGFTAALRQASPQKGLAAAAS
ncbi:hypothetical protein NSA36_14950 [Anaerotruncus colihominis]|nr:hypothetical protein [Anaerotruncus colihominis]